MAILKTSENTEKLSLEINNGDLQALNEIIRKWSFKDKESALRFAIAVLKITHNGSLCEEKPDGTTVKLQPTEGMLEKR